VGPETKSSRPAAAASRGNAVLVSAVVAWEISAKVRSGKWPEARMLSERFFATLKHYAWGALPITLEHAHLAGSCPGATGIRSTACLLPRPCGRDPARDADPAFRHFDVEVICERHARHGAFV
jgi:hypothetical protein